MWALGLVYGAADFRRTPEGDYVLLEVNPAGEWRFVEERTGQPMGGGHLLVTNVATRYPDVGFIFSHAGGTLVSIAQRIGA
jgi:hypothetical protein